MSRIELDLPRELVAAVVQAGVPMSVVCRGALGEAVERAAEARQMAKALRDPLTPSVSFRKLAESFRTRMRPSLVAALQVAAIGPEGENLPTVSSLDLLRGVLAGGDTLAVGLLVAEGVDVISLYLATRTRRCSEPAASIPDHCKVLFERLTMPGRLACAAALEVVVDLGHNYLGCEHLLIGLTASRGVAAEVLNEFGVKSSRERPTPVPEEIVVTSTTESRDRTRNDLLRISRHLDAMDRQLQSLDR